MGYVFTSDALLARVLRPLVRGLLRLALGGRGARLILQNPDDVALFTRSGLVDASSVRLIPGSGVDCTRFSPGQRTPREGGVFTVVLPARLLWDKGIAEYVDAARMLRLEGRAIEFLVAGEPDSGNPAAVPEAQLHAWIAEGCIRWLGHVDDMPSLFRGVDAVVLPSYREGLPKGLIEAGACALPLVTTDAPGCREVVQDRENGLLVPVRDARALARAIAELHDDPLLCQRLGQSARQRVLQTFGEQLVIRRTIAVYEELSGLISTPAVLHQ